MCLNALAKIQKASINISNEFFAFSFAVGLLIIGMCSFAFRYDEYFWQHDSEVPFNASELSWAFYLALVSCLLTIIAPILVTLEIFAGKYFAVNTEENDGL